jgi:hypothetical protein
MARFAALRVTRGVTVVVVFLAAACGRAEGSPKVGSGGPADLLLRGGAVYTVDAPRSWATAVGVRDGRISYVGGDSVPDGTIGLETEVVDLAGKMVLPGFQDGHVHLLLGGVELGECTLFTLESAVAIADSIAACLAARPDAPWVRGAGWELVSRLLPERTDAELAAGLQRGQRLANEAGVTSALEASTPESHLRAYAAADLAKKLTVRVTAAVDAEPDSMGIDSLVRRLRDWRVRYATPRVRPVAAKLYQDGVIESRTAALLAPYLDRKGDAGKAIHAQPRLDSLAIAHASRVNGPRDSRHTITHLQLIDPADISRFRSLGVVANFEPFWANGDEYLTKLAEPALGPSRSRWLYPIRSMAEAGAVVSGGSDWSVSSLAPLDGMQVAITRREPSAGTATPPWLPEEVVDLSDAIAMYTINAAYENHRERDTGSIEVGKLADLVILEQNLFEVAPREIHAVRVMRTILEGKTVFERRN